MSTHIPPHIKTIKYRITASIHQVKIAKKIPFYTRVQWKRHQNFAETTLIQHQNGLSVFDQELTLLFSFHYDTNIDQFLEKKCDMMVIIDMDGKGTIKNGGHARFDLAEALNEGVQSVKRHQTLVKNPDPEAYIDFGLVYEPLQEVDAEEMSVLNGSTLNMSTTDLVDSEISPEKVLGEKMVGENKLGKEGSLGDLVRKFQELAWKIKESSQSSNKSGVDNRMGQLEREIEALKESKEELEIRYEESEFLNSDMKRKIDTLERSRDPTQGESEERVGLSEKCDQQQGEILALRSTIQQLERKLEGVESNEESSQLREFEREKVKLEKNLADKSNQIGQLFNAAIEIGGAELLDKLQSAIGLIEQK